MLKVFNMSWCSASTPQEWVQLSNHNVVQAEEAMRVSQQMREDMSLSRAQVGELETDLHQCLDQRGLEKTGFCYDLSTCSDHLKESVETQSGADVCTTSALLFKLTQQSD